MHNPYAVHSFLTLAAPKSPTPLHEDPKQYPLRRTAANRIDVATRLSIECCRDQRRAEDDALRDHAGTDFIPEV